VTDGRTDGHVAVAKTALAQRRAGKKDLDEYMYSSRSFPFMGFLGNYMKYNVSLLFTARCT